MKNHLKTLQILHFIMAGLDFVWTAMFMINVVMMFVVGLGPTTRSGSPAFGPGAAPFPIWIFGAIYFGLAMFSLTIAILNIMAGLNIKRATKFKLCVAASIANLVPFMSCCYVLGIPLGVYGLVVLFNSQTQLIFKHVANGVKMNDINADGSLRKKGAKPGPGALAGSDDDIEVEGMWDEGSNKPPEPPPPSPPSPPPPPSAV